MGENTYPLSGGPLKPFLPLMTKMFHRCFFVLFLALICSALAAAQEPKVHLSFDNDSIVNLGTATVSGLSFYDQEGDAPVYVETGIGDIKAIKLDGTNYVSTDTSTTAFNIEGAKPKTVLAIIKSDVTGNYSLWTVGNPASYQDYTIKVNGADVLMGQYWGGDYTTHAPYPTTDAWALVALTYDGTTSRIYYNGLETGSTAIALNTGTGNLRVGFWNALANSYRGGIADFQIYDTALTGNQIKGMTRDYGGMLLTFNSSQELVGVNGGADGWIASNGKQMFTTQRSGSVGNLATNLNKTTNVYNQSNDTFTGVLWGEAFVVADDSKSLTIQISGGGLRNSDDTADHFVAPTTEIGPANIQSFANVAGFALYDATQGKFLIDSYRCTSHDQNESAYETKTIDLAGLTGHTIVPTVVDFATTSWGMTALKNLFLPLGTAEANTWLATSVTGSWTFDTQEEFESKWFEVDASGNRLDTITNFRLGAPGTCNGYVGSNFMSANGSSWDTTTGTLRSEPFKINGDVIEFLIDGGAAALNTGNNVEFQLWVDQEGNDTYEKIFTANRSTSDNAFEFQLWNVSDLKGMNAYFQVYDNRNTNWGWVGLDNIQMISFHYVPEPATWLLLLGGLFGLGVVRHKKSLP